MADQETRQILDEAIVKALEYENRVRDVYRDACEQTSDPTGRKVFEVLAEEEQGHVDYLEAKLETLRTTGEVAASRIETALPSSEAIEAGIAKLKSTLSGAAERKSHEQEESLLRKALAVEEETSQFYRRMVSDLPPQGQAFFGPFLAIEEGHVAIVQAELDSLTGMGFWFDFQEFDLETG